MKTRTLVVSLLNCVLSVTAVAQNTDSSANGINASQANYWEHAARTLNEQGETFRPFLYESLPIWGRLPSGVPQTNTLRTRTDEQQQLKLLLRHQCEPDMFQKMEDWAKSDDTQWDEFRIFMVTFLKTVELFHPKSTAIQIERKLRPFRQSNDVIGLKRAVAEIAAKLHRTMEALQNQAPIRLWMAIRIRLREYDMKTNSFLLRFPSGTLPDHVDGYDKIKLNWPANYPLPANWDVDRQTASGIKQHTSRSGVLALMQVELSQFRAVDNGDTMLSRELSARARVIETRLLTYDKNPQLLVTFPAVDTSIGQPETEHASASAETSPDDALAAKMKRLAAEHNLTVVRGGILVPDRDFRDSPAAQAYQKRLAQLLDRVVVTLNPAAFNALFASHRFPDTVGRDVIVQGRGRLPTDAQWAGRDEFAHEAVKERVWKRYLEKQEEIDVHLPLRFVATCGAYAERYDKESEAFSIRSYRDGAHEWFSKGLLAAGALPTPAMLRINRVFNSRLLETPVLFRRTLPVPTEKAPDFARRYGRQTTGESNPFCLATSFTINEIPHQPPPAPTGVPVMNVQGEWLTAFHDESLSMPMHNFELLQPSSPYVVSPANASYREATGVATLAGDTLWALALKEGKLEPSAATLTERILYRRTLWDQYELLRIRVRSATSALDRVQDRRNADADDVRHARQRKDKATADFQNFIRSMSSPFWPAPGAPTQEHAARLHATYQDWLQATLEHPCRYRVTCEVHPDPFTDDIALNFRLGARVGDDRITSLPGSLASVVQKSMNTESFYLLPKVMPNRFKIDDQRIEPCLQLSVGAAAMLKQIPREAFQVNESQRHRKLMLDIDLEFTETRWFTDPTDRHQQALVISARPVAGILRLDDAEIRFEGALLPDSHISPSPASEPSSPTMPVRLDEKPKLLTPSDIAPLLSELQGESFAGDVLQHLRHRYDYEDGFRRRPNDEKTRAFGIDPRGGLFFARQAPRPEYPASQPLQNQFLRWLKQRYRPSGSLWISDFERTFRERSDDGYPLALNSFHGRHLENLNREINRLEHRLEQEQQFQQNSRATYGADFTNSQEDTSAPFRAKLANLKRIMDNSTISLGWFDLSVTKPGGTAFVVPNLKGARRVSSGNSNARGKWDPDAPPPTEPIIPIVRFDSEIFLPVSAGITPQQQTFPIQLSYSVHSVEMADTPPWPTEEYLGTYGSHEGGQYYNGDDGRYVIFDAKIKSAFILHPRTRQPLIELTVKAARKLQPLEQLQSSVLNGKSVHGQQSDIASSASGNATGAMSTGVGATSELHPSTTPAGAGGRRGRLPLDVPFDFVAVKIPSPPAGSYLRIEPSGQWAIYDAKGDALKIPQNTPKQIDFQRARVPAPPKHTFMEVMAGGLWKILRVSNSSQVQRFEGIFPLNKSYGDPLVVVDGVAAPTPPLGGWVTLNAKGGFRVYEADGKLVNPQPASVRVYRPDGTLVYPLPANIPAMEYVIGATSISPVDFPATGEVRIYPPRFSDPNESR